MTWFAGTSTGNHYTVGQTYSNGSGTYRANANGSFTNVATGHTAVGSSQSNVAWGGSSLTGSTGGGGSAALPTNAPASAGPGAPDVGAAPTAGPGVAGVGVAPTAGAGVAGASSVNGRSAGAGAGWFGLFGQTGPHELPNKDPKLVSVQPITIGGVKVHVDRGFSDAGDWEQRYGGSELAQSVPFAINSVADAVKTFDDAVGPGWTINQSVVSAFNAINAWSDRAGAAIDGWASQAAAAVIQPLPQSPPPAVKSGGAWSPSRW